MLERFVVYILLRLLPLLIIAIALLWLCNYTIGLAAPILSVITPVLTTVCTLPGSSYLGVCPKRPPRRPPPPPLFFTQGLDYGSKLAEMQKMGAESVELPYLLQISEGSVRSMVVTLAAVDLPSK